MAPAPPSAPCNCPLAPSPSPLCRFVSASGEGARRLLEVRVDCPLGARPPSRPSRSAACAFTSAAVIRRCGCLLRCPVTATRGILSYSASSARSSAVSSAAPPPLRPPDIPTVFRCEWRSSVPCAARRRSGRSGAPPCSPSPSTAGAALPQRAAVPAAPVTPGPPPSAPTTLLRWRSRPYRARRCWSRRFASLGRMWCPPRPADARALSPAAAQPNLQVLQRFDDLSDLLCRAADPAECIRQVQGVLRASLLLPGADPGAGRCTPMRSGARRRLGRWSGLRSSWGS